MLKLACFALALSIINARFLPSRVASTQDYNKIATDDK